MPEYPNPKLRDVPSPDRPAVAAALAYAELDIKSNFSFLRGASHPDELVYRAAELGYRAVALTDFNTLAGVVRAHEAAREAGIHLLLGARLTLADAPDLLVWAPDRAAYARLCRLLTLGKRRTEKGQCLLWLADFLAENNGLLAAVTAWSSAPPLTRLGGGNDAWPPSSAPDVAATWPTVARALGALREAMGDRLSLAAGCAYGPDDALRLAQLAELSHQFDVPLLATNDVYYHDPGRRMLQDVLTCVRHGCTIGAAGFNLFPNGERYLKSPEQMHRLFADYPAALRRGVQIAERCNFKLDELRYEYPDELTTPGKSAREYLAELTWNGAATRYGGDVPPKVRALLEHELALIEQLRFEHYFLTVHDLVVFARSRGILCQGRGSAANSAVCYCLGVTSVDPEKIDLLFERFISAARGEPPDIDIDFEHERREEVLQYLYDKYGRDRAALTAEVITYRGRSAVRDVGKAMGLSLDMVDSLAGKLDWWHKGVVSDEQIRETGLDPADLTLRQVMALATQLLGFPRHLSQHVGGMVMTRGPLCEMVPIENASMPDRTVIEWDKDDIDVVGILKVDVLALGMLTCISKAFGLIEKFAGGSVPRKRAAGDEVGSRLPAAVSGAAALIPSPLNAGAEEPENAPASPRLELHTIPSEDPLVYDMMSSADTVGVFQIESRAQMSMLPRLRPRCFYDIVIEVAIVRPGPIQGDMVHPYLRRRAGLEPVVFPSEPLRQVLQKTLGVPLFQEQAMRVAMVGAGFTAEEADKLRRVMAAWKRNGDIEKFHRKIVDGMIGNGYTPQFAQQCFNQIKGFGEYGFPESHSASFALLVYVSAWIKRHHPAAFAAALLNSQPMGFYMPAQIVRDAKEHGVHVLSVDVNHSDWDCLLEDQESSPPRHRGTEANLLVPRGDCELSFVESEKQGQRGVLISLASSDDPTGSNQLYPLESQYKNPSLVESHKSAELASVPRCLGGESPRISNEPATWGADGPAVRLGLRELKGFGQAHAEALMGGRRRVGRFHSVAQVHRLSGLPVSAMKILAEADAFGSLGLCRRDALWQVMRLKDEHYPLFDGMEPPEAAVALPPMPEGQEVMTDYQTAGLSLKRHPVALLREELRRRKIISAADLQNETHDRWVKVAGIVLIRQRPGTASGVVFETLEDETGIINLIVHPKIYDQYRPAARHARLLQADGYVQRQGQIVHVLPKRLIDLSDLMSGFSMPSRDFH